MSGIGFSVDSTARGFSSPVTVMCPRLVASLRPLAEHEGGRVHIDTLKVPHHDSDHNVPRELLHPIDCRHY
jgi:hypothetical protein